MSLRCIRDDNGDEFPVAPLGANQVVSYTAVAAATAALGTGTSMVRAAATTDCWFLVSNAGTAAVAGTDIFLPAKWVEYIPVGKGQKISFIRDSADGKVSVTELT